MSKEAGQIDFEYEGEEYTADITQIWTGDSAYGADADGNRGEARSWIDDVIVEALWHGEVKLWDKVANKGQAKSELIKSLIAEAEKIGANPDLVL